MHTINDSKDIENFIEHFLNSEEGAIQLKEYYHDATTMEGWKEYLFDQILSVLQAGLISHLESNLSNLEDLYSHSLDIEKKYKASELMKEKTSILSNLKATPKATGASADDDSGTESDVDGKYTIDFCIQQYSKSYEGSVEIRTLDEDIRILQLFRDALGKDLLSQLTPKDLSQFEVALKGFHKNKNKYSHTKSLSFNDSVTVAKERNMDTISATTLKRYLRVVSSFMSWCFDNNFIDTPLGQNLGKRVKNARSTRKIYSNDDISRLFEPQHFKNSIKNSPARFWMPIIGLFSGARIEEIATLKTSDILEIDGVWCFSINDEEKRLKTENSIRKIPLHDTLIQIGILEHLAWVKNSTSSQYLLPDIAINNKNDKLSSKYSKWWSRYVKSLLESPEGKVFHSFRHTLTTELNLIDMASNKKKYILGHAQSDVTSGVYTHDYNLRTIKRELDKVQFSLNISELRKMWLAVNKRFLRIHSK